MKFFVVIMGLEIFPYAGSITGKGLRAAFSRLAVCMHIKFVHYGTNSYV